MLRNCACLVIAHMVDATQLCLSCHCTHGGCYATEFVLSLHTWWMLRNCACLLIAHMVDATQLSLSCACLPKLTGTQCLDQTWKQLKRDIPKELRSRDQTTRRDNHRLEEYVWSFLFRMNVRPKLLEALGKFGPKSKQCYKIEKKRLFFGGGF